MQPRGVSLSEERLTEAMQSEVVQHLPMPLTNAPDLGGNAYSSILSAKDMPLSHDRSVLEQVARLIRAVDTAYLRMRSALPPQSSRGGPLRKELERIAPNLFQDSARNSAAPQRTPERHPAEHQVTVDATVLHPKSRSQQKKRKLKASIVPFRPPQMDAGDSSPDESAAPTAGRTAACPGSAALQTGEASVSQKPKRRKEIPRRTWNTMQAEKVMDVNIAEKFSKAVGVLVEKMRSLDEGNFDVTTEGQCFLSLEELSAFNIEAMQAADSGALKDVALDDLVEIIAVLNMHVKGGAGVLLNDDDDISSASCDRIMTACEACLCMLRLMTGDDMPVEVFNEDAIESLMEFVCYHLKYNIYVFHDPIQRRRYRPNEGDDDAVLKTAKKARQGKNRAHNIVSEAASQLSCKMEAIVCVLQHLFPRVTAPASQANSLVNTVMQALTIDGLEALQTNSIAVLVSIYQNYVGQRKPMIESFVGSVLFNIPIGPHSRRFLVPSEDDLHVLPVCALMTQLAQVSCSLPSQDSELAAKMSTFTHCIVTADAIWSLVVERLPQAKAQKSDTEYDMRGLLEMIVLDLISLMFCPDWPGASTMLVRLVAALGGPKGLQHSDSFVRQACVDILGMLAARLSSEIKAANEDADWVDSIVRECVGRPTVLAQGAHGSDPLTLDGDAKEDALCARAQWLLLDHLIRGPTAYFQATVYNLCLMFSEEIRYLVADEGGEKAFAESELLSQQVTDLLVVYRQIAGRRVECAPCRFPEGVILGRAAACHVSRYIFKRSPLGKGIATIVRWIVDMLDRSKQVPATRAKAVKALGMIVEADTSLLAKPEVKVGVNRSLHDEAISVREAAVDLLGRHIGSSAELAVLFFDLISQAAVDSGTSVRKRAVRILWESCIRAPSFPRSTEACIRLLQRVSDPEESIRALVHRIFQDLWFKSSGDQFTNVVVKIHQIADVATCIYDGTGSNIHLPLSSSHPLVSVVRNAIYCGESSSDVKTAERCEAKKIIDALHEQILKSEDALASAGEALGTGAQHLFPLLLSLYVFAAADAAILIDQKDPFKFLRHLTPYLKGLDERHLPSAGTPVAVEKASRRSAEKIICIIYAIDAMLPHLKSIPKAIMDDLLQDLTSLVQRHNFVQVVAAACQCLGSLALVDERAVKHMSKVIKAIMNKLLEKLAMHSGKRRPGPLPGDWVPATSRLLYLLGQLCRHGKSPASFPASEWNKVVRTVLEAFYVADDGQCYARLKETALQTVGCLIIADPAVMLRDDVDRLLSSALAANTAPNLKIRALKSLGDLLKCEEQQLLQDQKIEGDGKSERTSLKAAGLRVASAPVQTQNGERDRVSLASGVIQRHWESILALATDAPPPTHEGDVDRHEASSATRQSAMDLMDSVLRAGLVAPWTAVPQLVALATDPCSATAVHARRILKQESSKHADFFDGRLAEGIEVCFKFHYASCLGDHKPMDDGRIADIVQGLAQLYTTIIQPNRGMKVNFLATLLKKFEFAVDMDSSPATESDLSFLRFLSHVAAMLPFRRSDEPLSILHCINGIVSRRAEFVRSSLKSKLKSAKGVITELSHAVNQKTGSTPQGPAVQRYADGALLVDSNLQRESLQEMMPELRGAYTVSLLLQLKQYLKAAYRVDGERLANFSPTGEKRKHEERIPCAKVRGVALDILPVPVAAFTELQGAASLYNAFKALMEEDSADYGDGVHLNLSKKARKVMESLQEEAK